MGEGASAAVYLYENINNNKLYAIKVIKTRDEEIESQIIGQFKKISTLKHANIIKLKSLYINRDKARIYLIMEYFDSVELFFYIQNLDAKRYNETEVKKIFLDICNGVQYLHENGVVHRDIKPNNILINTENNSIKITDFNVAKFIDYKSKVYNNSNYSNYKMMTYTGTIAFCAPEVLLHNVYTFIY